MKYGKFLFGLLAGTAIGATLGVLFAPDKGSATRKRISRQSNEYSNAAGKKLSQLVDGSADQRKAVRQSAGTLTE